MIAVAFTGSLLKLVPALQGNRPVGGGHHARRDLAGRAHQPARREGSRHVRGDHDLHEAGAVCGHRDRRAGVRPVRAAVASSTRAASRCSMSSAALAPLTMFAYLGLESATVPAGDVRDPERTIPRSTMLGICVAALLYVLGTTVVLGVVPREQLVNSTAPFADAARLMWGAGPPTSSAVAVMVSSLGALNGWTLMMGQVPMAAAADGCVPDGVRPAVAARRAGGRHRDLGGAGDGAGAGAGRRADPGSRPSTT